MTKMAIESHKTKKLTKKQIIKQIPKVVEQDLQKNFIKNIMIGFETANQMILDKINNGASLDEIKELVELNLKNKNLIGKVANGINKTK